MRCYCRKQSAIDEKTKRQAIEIMDDVTKSEISAGKDPMGLAATVLYILCLVFLYNNAELFTMIKQICLIAIVAIGLAVLIPGTNVQAKTSHYQSHLHSSGGIGLGIGAIVKFKQHKDNPIQH
jgi:transcription initiation factor TFIIIB Brf1 subunit/transcription initiation factor TFIIB